MSALRSNPTASFSGLLLNNIVRSIGIYTVLGHENRHQLGGFLGASVRAHNP